MVKINIIILIIRRLLDRKRSGNTIIILTKKEEWYKIRLSKLKVITIITNQTEKDVPRKISRNKSVQNTIISIPKVKLTFIKAL